MERELTARGVDWPRMVRPSAIAPRRPAMWSCQLPIAISVNDSGRPERSAM